MRRAASNLPALALQVMMLHPSGPAPSTAQGPSELVGSQILPRAVMSRGCVLCRQLQAEEVFRSHRAASGGSCLLCVCCQSPLGIPGDGAAHPGSISFSHCSTRLVMLIYLPSVFLPLFLCLLRSSACPAMLFPCACSCCRNSFGFALMGFDEKPKRIRLGSALRLTCEE